MEAFKPFSDPRVQRRQKLAANASFKAFNAVASRFLGDLLRMYPDDVLLKTICKTLKDFSEDKQQFRVPGLTFFREIRKANVGKCGYVDLLVNHDPKAFDDPIPVQILQTAGLSSKWASTDEQVRKDIWEYVDRLVRLSAQAVFSASDSVSEMNDLSRSIVMAAKDAGGAIGDPRDLASDPRVQLAANKFVESIK
jgi:hypothetical protein